MTEHPTSIRIDRQTREALIRRAKADGRSLANYIGRLLEAHVANTPEPDATKPRKKT